MINTRVYKPGVGMVPVTVGVGTTVLIQNWSFQIYDDYRYGVEAIYYDTETGEWKKVSVESTRIDATVDATDEIKALYAKKLADEALAKAKAKRDAEAQASAAADAAKLKKVDETYSEVSKGDFVTVYKGRKVPKGTVGRVFWIGENKWGWSVGIIDAAGDKFFTALGNVKKTSVPAEKVRRAIVTAQQEDREAFIAKKRAEREGALA